MSDDRLRIALHTGVVFRRDAVSNSLLEKLAAVDEARREGTPVEAVAMTTASDVERPDIAVTPGATATIEHPRFWDADVHVYEFGIWYEGFDTVFVVPPAAATVAVYHNVTPPELVADADARALLERSCAKKGNLAAFDHVVCDSEYSRAEVVAMGMAPERTSVVPLPPSVEVAPAGRRPPGPDDPVRLLYVGRFVAAKGVLELVEAVRLAAGLVHTRFRLVLAGNERLSDPAVLAELRRKADPALVELRGEVDDDELARLYGECDALVMPSHHEGYCVPVVEAISAGAHVVATDAGNLPHIVGGLGRTVPVGDVDALAKAVAELVDRVGRARRGEPLEVPTDDGPLDEATWLARVDEHRLRHSRPAFRRGFWAAVAAALAAKGRAVPTWLEARA